MGRVKGQAEECGQYCQGTVELEVRQEPERTRKRGHSQRGLQGQQPALQGKMVGQERENKVLHLWVIACSNTQHRGYTQSSEEDQSVWGPEEGHDEP